MIRSHLARLVPTSPTSEEELETLRRRAWESGILTVSIFDDRLSWPDREYLRQIGRKSMASPRTKIKPVPPTRDELRDRLREAARTLRSVKLTARDIPQSMRSAWPEIVREAADQFAAEVGATESEVKDMHAPRLRVRLCPSAAEISRMDEALSWLEWIHGDERRIVFARSLRIPYGVLALNFHCSSRKILDIEIRGLKKIAEKIFA